jgi:FkbM family methyltransferase
MPEYLKNKIDKIKDEAEVWVFEKRHESSYNTIRKRIQSILGSERIITWGDKPEDILIRSIKEMKPDIIHFEEPCEQFVSHHLLDIIFSPDREYKIFETMHDSSVSPMEKIYLPDKFVVVSPWQVNLLRDLRVPIEVIEHEITKKPVRDYLDSRTKLGLDPNKKHIIQIGIFTPRKNQRETAELARLLPEVEFHFIGTLADNFKWYWNPITSNLPSNCKVWGERDDVDLFYQAADLVIFPSIPLFNDKETSPLVIKEAISWKSPLLLRNLPVYVDMYQDIANQIREILDPKKELAANNKSDMFIHKFSPRDNKLDIVYIGDSRNIKELNCDVYVKDVDSGSNIFHCIINFSLGASYWIIPVPIHIYDFQNNPNFGGFLIEYKQGDEVISESVIRFRNVTKKTCRLDTKDPIFRNYEEFFTDRIYDIMTNSIFKKKIAIDVGANVGLFTEYCLDVGFEKVISIEPNPLAANEFRKMHSENPNVIFSEIALTGDGEDVNLSVNPRNTLVSSIAKTISENTVLVKSKTLNSLLSDYDSVDLLKIDIEGAEYDLLDKTNIESLSKADNIILEFHDNNDGRVNSLIEKLVSADFAVKLYDELIQKEVDNNANHGVIFAKRKG